MLLSQRDYDACIRIERFLFEAEDIVDIDSIHRLPAERTVPDNPAGGFIYFFEANDAVDFYDIIEGKHAITRADRE